MVAEMFDKTVDIQEITRAARYIIPYIYMTN